MADALAMVNVGNSEWLLTSETPWRANATMFGAFVSLTMRERKPSATKTTTLWGADGIGAT
jgi:hypothetical protein